MASAPGNYMYKKTRIVHPLSTGEMLVVCGCTICVFWLHLTLNLLWYPGWTSWALNPWTTPDKVSRCACIVRVYVWKRSIDTELSTYLYIRGTLCCILYKFIHLHVRIIIAIRYHLYICILYTCDDTILILSGSGSLQQILSRTYLYIHGG